ncbi:DNA-binding response regulator, partial [Mesorhizobium sp. M7A.F.Ca.US.006.04.2.1]
MEDHELGMAVEAKGSIDEWRVKEGMILAAILFNLGGRKVTDHGIA